jgi:hypothetical protein
MEQLISLLVMVLIFALVAYGLWWVCVKFGLPQPVLWIVGVILLIFLLYFIAGQIGVGGQLFPVRRP